MSGPAFIIWLAWVAVACYAISSARELGHRVLDQREHAEPQEPEAVVVPDDLTALALGETEKWAQDSVLATIRERWDLYRDWNKVRAAFGVALRDD